MIFELAMRLAGGETQFTAAQLVGLAVADGILSASVPPVAPVAQVRRLALPVPQRRPVVVRARRMQYDPTINVWF